MLVGARPEVDVHAQVFGEKLGCVAVAHDDALQIRFQQSDDINFELLDQIAHAILGRPHVVVKGEVDGPNTGCNGLCLGVVRCVVVRWEAEISGCDGECFKETEDVEVV